jgi:copper(I)-binding protein
MNAFVRLPVLLLALVLPAAVQASSSSPQLHAEQAWIRSAPPASPVMAGYATLRNDGGQPLRLEALRSTAFGRVELHEMREVEGVMRMRPLALELAPGASLRLAPGGAHLMLMQPAAPLAEGARIEVEFCFEGGAVQPVEFEVRATAPSD